jgi:hypothetical protein
MARNLPFRQHGHEPRGGELHGQGGPDARLDAAAAECGVESAKIAEPLDLGVSVVLDWAADLATDQGPPGGQERERLDHPVPRQHRAGRAAGDWCGGDAGVLDPGRAELGLAQQESRNGVIDGSHARSCAAA